MRLGVGCWALGVGQKSPHPTPHTLLPLPWTDQHVARPPSSPAARSDDRKETDAKYRSGFSIRSRPARAIAPPASPGRQRVPARDITAADRTQTRFGSRCDPLHELIAAQSPASPTTLLRRVDSGRFQRKFRCSWFVGLNFWLSENP